MEEEEAGTQMERLQATLASANSQIQVNRSVMSLVVVDCNLELIAFAGVDEDSRAAPALGGAGCSSPRGEQVATSIGGGAGENAGRRPQRQGKGGSACDSVVVKELGTDRPAEHGRSQSHHCL